MEIELICGLWEDVLADRYCDALITDPPYGLRTHKGNENMLQRYARSDLVYKHWTPEEATAFVNFWSPRTRGWMCIMTSDDLIPVYRQAYADNGRYDFAPVPILQHRPRLAGDGPGSGAVYLMVARPKESRFMGWGSLPCWYQAAFDQDGHIGGKPLKLMQAIVMDYSDPGDLVCDPCAGAATTLLAAAMKNRRGIGAEADPVTFTNAMNRIGHGWTPDLFGGESDRRKSGTGHPPVEDTTIYTHAPKGWETDGLPYGAPFECCQCHEQFKSSILFDCYALQEGAPLMCEICLQRGFELPPRPTEKTHET